MTAPWDPQLRNMAEAARAALADWRCATCARPLPDDRRISATGVMQIVLEAFGVAAPDFLGPGLKPRVVAARAAFAWALRTLGKPRSYPAIGELLGGRHYSSIIHLHQKAIALRLRSTEFDAVCRRMTIAFHAEEASHASH